MHRDRGCRLRPETQRLGMAKVEAERSEWSTAQEVVLSVDLVKAAKRQLQFLAAVDDVQCLHDGPGLDRAIYRYNIRPGRSPRSTTERHRSPLFEPTMMVTFKYIYFRYEYCWLPLLAKHTESPLIPEPLVVPLDCEWIWHCHRLNPVKTNIMEIILFFFLVLLFFFFLFPFF